MNRFLNRFFNTRNASGVITLLVVYSVLISFRSEAQGNELDNFRKQKETAARRKEEEVKDFLKLNQLQLSFTSEEGSHYLLVEVRNGKPVYRMTLNAEAAISTSVTGLRSEAGQGFNLQGDNMTVGIFDDGLVKDHIELGARVIAKEGKQEQTHSTHVTGTIIASGVNAAAKGMAPKAKAATFYFQNDELKMSVLAKSDQNSLLLSNHSYGETTGWYKSNNVWLWSGNSTISSDEDFRFGFYGDRAKSLDELVYLAPYYSIIWAAGNDRAEVGDGSRLPDCNGGTGFDCIIPDAVAKNIITVGAVNKVLNYTNSSSVQMSSFSSWGPTDDGRIKPDLVGAGVNLFSLSAIGENTYASSSGTSMATPNVTGSLLLLQELYSKLHGGEPMKASTLKALAIHTVKEAGNFPGPDYSYGWGLLDVSAAARLLRDEDGKQTLVANHDLMNGENFELELQPKANQKITATIVWTDPAGLPVADGLDPANLMLVNDLDVRIIDEQGNKQFPWILDPLNPAKKADRGDNFRDNVEKLEFELPLEKKYKLIVNHKGQLTRGHQNFSIILSYKSIGVTKTFYWVGGSGNWSEANHWSVTSGGVSGLAIPSAEDKVIVDENSFNGAGDNRITLTEDVSITSLLWLDSESAGIDFNTNKVLTLSDRLTLASDAFHPSGNGTFHVNNAGTQFGDVSIKQASLPGISIKVSGKWNLLGEAVFDELNIITGKLIAHNAKLSLKKLNATGNLTKGLAVNGAQITIRESSNLNGSNLTMHSDSTTLIRTGSTTLNWQDINFVGEVISETGTTIFNGKSHFSKVTINDNSEWNGIIQVDELEARPETQLLLGNSTELILNSKAKLTGMPGKPVSIVSNSKAVLNFSDHSKYCFDFLKVANVDVKNGAVNAGLNSTITASNNWQQKKCEDVLFADFEVNYDCANAIAEFIDTSGGAPDQWQWKFGSNVIRTAQNANFKFENAGTYPVSLTVSKDGNSQTYTTNIMIKENTIPENTIAINNETMTSLLIADKYQWMKNGVPIATGNQRTYAYDGEDGLYFVIIYDNQCNISSETITITGGGTETSSEIIIYPNPASEQLTIGSTSGIQSVEVLDIFGHTVYAQQADSNQIQIEIQNWPASIYFVRILSSNRETRKRIIKR